MEGFHVASHAMLEQTHPMIRHGENLGMAPLILR